MCTVEQVVFSTYRASFRSYLWLSITYVANVRFPMYLVAVCYTIWSGYIFWTQIVHFLTKDVGYKSLRVLSVLRTSCTCDNPWIVTVQKVFMTIEPCIQGFTVCNIVSIPPPPPPLQVCLWAEMTWCWVWLSTARAGGCLYTPTTPPLLLASRLRSPSRDTAPHRTIQKVCNERKTKLR